MESTTKARLNHYETLGLAPDASDQEIARAYARQVGMFGSRPVSDVARASIAFETLRDRVRRRAYDESLGLGVKAPPRIVATAGRARFAGVAAADPLAGLRSAVAGGPVAPSRFEPPVPQPQAPPSEPRTASFIAASLRAPAVPIEEPVAAAEQDPIAVHAEPARRVEHPRIPELRLADADESPVQLSRTVAIGAGLIGCVVVLGAMLGLEAGNGEQARPAEAAVTAALPAPKPAPRATVPTPAEPRAFVSPSPVRPTRSPEPVARNTPIEAAPQSAAPQLASAEPAAAVAVDADQPASDPLAPSPEPARTATALPLSNATIARTIERIGYSCGKVASTAPDDGGAAGVFTVTCTSGQSYRAAPVHGRYRFRRIAG